MVRRPPRRYSEGIALKGARQYFNSDIRRRAERPGSTAPIRLGRIRAADRLRLHTQLAAVEFIAGRESVGDQEIGAKRGWIERRQVLLNTQALVEVEEAIAGQEVHAPVAAVVNQPASQEGDAIKR